MSEARWFEYDQNNSAGEWKPPAIRVVVEAKSKDEADVRAMEHGVDESAPFCRCCGERWSLSYPPEHMLKPSIRDLFCEGFADSSLYKDREVPRVLYVYANGSTEVVP